MTEDRSKDNRVRLDDSAALEMTRARTRFGNIASAVLIVMSTMAVFMIVSRSLPIGTKAVGIMWPDGGIARLHVNRAGVVETVIVEKGDLVKQRQPLLVVRHQFAPAEYLGSVEALEKDTVERLTQVRAAIEKFQLGLAADHVLDLVRLEDELARSLVQTREKLQSIRSGGATVLYSPRPGRLVELRAVVGAEVTSGQSLATVISDAPTYGVRAYVPAEVSGRLEPGGIARVELMEPTGRILKTSARVVEISSLPISPQDVDRTVVITEPLYEIVLRFTPEDSLHDNKDLAPGRPVAVYFDVQTKTVFEWMISRFAL